MTSAASCSTPDDLVAVSVSFPGGWAHKVFTSEYLLRIRETGSRICPGHRASGLPDADVAAIIAISDAIAKWPGCSAQERDEAALNIAFFTAHLSLDDPRLVKVLREKRVSRIWYHLRINGVLLLPPIQMKVFLHDYPEPELNSDLFDSAGLPPGRIESAPR